MEPLIEIEAELYDFYLNETFDPKNPIMGRIIIGNGSNKPMEDLHVHDWKIVVLEIGLEYHEKEEYEWYWEITIRNISNTQLILNKHNTGYTASYVPGGRGCSGIPTDWSIYEDEIKDFADLIIEDINIIE
ncbi:MAG: hypothetical protein ACP5C3_07120 [Methanomicrobiales archaeon]